LCPSGPDAHELELPLDKPHRGAYAYACRRADAFDVFLQTQSGAETREILSDDEREIVANAEAEAVRRHSAANVAPDAFALAFGDETESDEVEYYSRQLYGAGPVAAARPRRRMNTATAAAFRAKLKEPGMSPSSKLRLLGTARADADADADAAKENGNGNPPGSCSAHSIEIEPISDGNPAEDDEEGGEDEDEEDFKFIRIIVPPGPCGVVFQPQTDASMPPTVERFERMYDGRKGPIENCQLVSRGSVLCSINDLDVTHIPLPDLLRALTLSAHVEREFVFRK
jgi:hypothetical protein